MYIPNGFVNGRIACTFAFTHIHDGDLIMHCSVGLPTECCWNFHLYMLAGFIYGRIACTCPFTYLSDGYLLMHDCSNVTAIQHIAGIKQTSKLLLCCNFCCFLRILLLCWNFAALLEFCCCCIVREIQNKLLTMLALLVSSTLLPLDSNHALESTFRLVSIYTIIIWKHDTP